MRAKWSSEGSTKNKFNLSESLLFQAIMRDLGDREPLRIMIKRLAPGTVTPSESIPFVSRVERM